MIPRMLSKPIAEAMKYFPIVGVVGPRQSGKTTLVRSLFPDFEYVNLEQLDNRQFAQSDPRGFLAHYNNKVIIDEAQRVPDLFSYLQVHVDNVKNNGQFVLTGSQHFLMMQSISQTLAGRIALFDLYALSYEELKRAGISEQKLLDQILKGGYPKLYDQEIPLSLWFANYIQTYLDRDVSMLSQIENLSAFEKFIRLSAGRTGQLLNLSSLGSEVGVTHNTIKTWISLLQTSGIVYLLQPYFINISKRLNKSPKLYFMDTGLCCHLLGINFTDQLYTHPLFGNLFETFILSEFIKHKFNTGSDQEIYFWRDQSGVEADILKIEDKEMDLYEIKSAATVPTDAFDNLELIKKVVPQKTNLKLIYGGGEVQRRTSGEVISWKKLFG